MLAADRLVRGIREEEKSGTRREVSLRSRVALVAHAYSQRRGRQVEGKGGGRWDPCTHPQNRTHNPLHACEKRVSVDSKWV